MKFDYLVDQLSLESLRFKPVGPVIIRQACDDVTLDTLLQDGSKLQVKKGDYLINYIELNSRRVVLPFNLSWS